MHYGQCLRAELMNSYLEVNGDANAFEARAALPRGTVAQSHSQAPTGKQTISPSTMASPNASGFCVQCLSSGYIAMRMGSE